MNPNASVDSMIAQMGKPQPQPTIKFTSEETGDDSKGINTRVNRRIHALLSREVLTPLDVTLLDVLLKYCVEDL